MSRSLGVSDSIALEAQLLYEETWIIATLKRIKEQRNSLQIEKLHLESLEAKLKAEVNSKRLANQNYVQANPVLPGNPDCFSNVQGTQYAMQIEQPQTVAQPQTVEQPAQNMDLDNCNDEELDLAVSKSVYSHDFRKNVFEEYEEEDDDDMLIDINMLMNAQTSCEKGNTD